MTASIRVENQLTNIVAGDKLRPGDIISARVTENLPGNRFRILWNGRTLTADSHLNLTKGQVIRAQVETGSAGVTLRLLAGSQGAASEVTGGAASLPNVLSPVQQLITSFLKASLSIPPDSDLQRMGRLLGHARGRRPRLARLQVDLLSRGSDPSADFLEALEDLLDRSDRQKHGNGGGRGNRQPPGPEELKQMAAGEENESLLNLINKAPGRSEDWIYHRTSTGNDENGPQLTWKIRRGHIPALALTVRDRGRAFEFLLEGINPGKMDVHYEGPESKEIASEISPEMWDAFRETLSLMNISVNDTLLPMDLSDGFTPGEWE